MLDVDDFELVHDGDGGADHDAPVPLQLDLTQLLQCGCYAACGSQGELVRKLGTEDDNSTVVTRL